MTGITPYLLFPGNADEALEFYRSVFGGALQVQTYGQFGRSDGPADAIAHGALVGPVPLFGADAGSDEDAVHVGGMYFSLLGAAAPPVLDQWFAALAAEGRVILPLEARARGASDGQLIDRYGVRWSIGYERG